MKSLLKELHDVCLQDALEEQWLCVCHNQALKYTWNTPCNVSGVGDNFSL